MFTFPDDKIRIILYAMDISTDSVKFDEETFHTIIYEYKKKYPELFQEFSFRLNGTFPYSELLGRAITRAKISRTLKTSNPDFISIQLTKIPIENIKSEFKGSISESDFTILTEIAHEFKQQLKSCAIH